MSADGETYEVGYGKPPVQTRFKPGQSGNPKGRPRGRLNVVEDLEAAFKRKLVIMENGKRKTITALQAACIQIANQAAAGKQSAFQFAVKYLNRSQEPSLQPKHEVDWSIFTVEELAALETAALKIEAANNMKDGEPPQT